MAGTGKAHLRNTDDVLLRVEDLVVEFPIGRTGLKVNALSGISFDVLIGETLGIVGESGCGKSTTGRAIMQLPSPTSGSIVFNGTDLTALSGEAMREARTKIQMIFQDPISSLNPRRNVRDIVLEPLSIWNRGTKAEQLATVDKILEHVGIDPERAAESNFCQRDPTFCCRRCIRGGGWRDPARCHASRLALGDGDRWRDRPRDPARRRPGAPARGRALLRGRAQPRRRLTRARTRGDGARRRGHSAGLGGGRLLARDRRARRPHPRTRPCCGGAPARARPRS